jgi:glucokinase
LLDVADHARRRGAAVVALTTRRSPLARQADTVLALDPADGLADPVPTVHRILQGLMLDILAAGVAARVAAGEAARLAARVVPAADR